MARSWKRRFPPVRAACATPTTFGGANDMCRAYAANALPAMTCDEGLSAQHRQENAEALRVAQGFVAATYYFQSEFYSILSSF